MGILTPVWEVSMAGKIIGLTVILLLALSIIATGIGAVAQVGSLDPSNATGPSLAQSNKASVMAVDDENALYTAFTYVCPFH